MNRSKLLRLMALVLLAAMFGGCKPSHGGGKSKGPRELPAELAAAYREDAARLALREVLTTTQTGENGASIPQARIDFYYGLLGKVYWMCKDVDSIPDLSSIHTLGNPNLKQVVVVLDKSSPFVETWNKYSTMTSNLYLNQLLSRYKVSIKNARQTALGPTYTLEAADYVNTKELAFLIKNVETVRHAEPEGLTGDGNDITYGSDGKNAMALKYSIGEGDCPSGCTQRKYWVFYVLVDGSIQYMGTRGSISPGLEPPR